VKLGKTSLAVGVTYSLVYEMHVWNI